MQSSWIMAPYMVETAFRYYRAAQHLWGIESGVAVINAALSIEILLKSYNSEVVANEGDINQKHKFNAICLSKGQNKHNLFDLFSSLPKEAKDIFHEAYILELLDKYQNTYISERYLYEPNTRGGGSTALIDLAKTMIDRTVTIYKERECNDPWVVHYPNI